MEEHTITTYNKDIDSLIDITLSTNSEYDIGILFYKIFKNEYKTFNKPRARTKTNAKSNKLDWYIFTNEKWKKEENVKIFEIFKNTLKNLYKNKIDLLNTELNAITNENSNYKNVNKKIIITEKILNKIEKDYFIKNIMNESAELFYYSE